MGNNIDYYFKTHKRLTKEKVIDIFRSMYNDTSLDTLKLITIKHTIKYNKELN